MNVNHSDSYLSFQNVIKLFSGERVLDGLSFDVKEHEFVALIGNNGCGKTTTVNILCNMINYDSGDVVVLGEKVNPRYFSYKKRMGIVLNSPYLIEEFTPEEYLAFVGKFQSLKSTIIKNRVYDMLKLFGLEENKLKSIKKLSSGNQMKLSIAAAIIHNPDILVLDEPFVNLDVGMQAHVKGILKRFKNHKTLFITSHNLDNVIDICDTFLIMEKGKITEVFIKNAKENTTDLKEMIIKILSKEDLPKQLEWLP